MARRRRKPSDATRPQPARPAEGRAAGAGSAPAGGPNRRREIDGPMRSVYMLAVLYAITLEAVQDPSVFPGSAAAGKARADAGAGRDTET